MYKIPKEELDKIICDLSEKCPVCLTSNQGENEVKLNVKLISPIMFYKVTTYIKSIIGNKTSGARK